MDVSTIVVKCHSLHMATSVLNACDLITQVQQTHLLRWDSDDIIHNTEDEKYDHAALKEMVIGFQTNLGLNIRSSTTTCCNNCCRRQLRSTW